VRAGLARAIEEHTDLAPQHIVYHQANLCRFWQTENDRRVWIERVRVVGLQPKRGRRFRRRLSQLRADLPVLLRLAQAWARKEYRTIPWKSIVSVLAALLYFISPIDLIPDLIPIFGFIDDAAVVAYVLKSVKADLEAFQAWEAGDNTGSENVII